MIFFNNDYSEGCHEKVLEALVKTNYEQTPGYGEDAYCARAAAKIRALCEDDTLAVHFLVGGTQANTTVIAADKGGEIPELHRLSFDGSTATTAGSRNRLLLRQ